MVVTTGPSPHLGREAELDRVLRRLDAAGAGSGGLVVLRGPSGTGTTRMAHEVAARADRAGMLVLWGRSGEGLYARPFGALAEALEEYALGIQPRTLAEQVGPGGPVLARMAPRIRSVLPGIPPPAPLEPADERLRLHGALLAWVERICHTRPVLLVVDDLQDADGDVEGAIRRLAAAAPALPLLLLATSSHEVEQPPELGAGSGTPDDRTTNQSAEFVDLPPLDAAAIGALLRGHSPMPLDDDVATEIWRASAGHPLLARHLLDHLVEEGGLRAGPGGAAAPPPLPGSLDEVLRWRLLHLTPEARATLGALSIFPTGSSAHVVAQVARLTRARAVESLEAAASRGIVRRRPTDETWEFTHGALRNALRHAVQPAREADLHAQAAEVLELEHGDRSREHAGALAHHHHHAAGARPDRIELAERGARYALLAAEQSRAAGAQLRAVRALEVAVELMPAEERAARMRLLARLAAAQAEAGLGEAFVGTAIRALEAAARSHSGVQDVVDALVVGLRSEAGGRPWTGGERELRERVAALAPRADDLAPARLELLAEDWRAHDFDSVRLLTPVDGADAAAALLLERGDEADGAAALSVSRRRTRDQTAAALRLVRKWRRPASVLRGLRAVATDLGSRHGLFREAVSWAGQYLAVAERYGSPRDRVLALALLARGEAVLGEFGAARDHLAAASAELAAIGGDGTREAWRDHPLQAEILLSGMLVAHYLDADWSLLRERAEALPPTPLGIAVGAWGIVGAAQSGHEMEARRGLPALLRAVSLQPPLALGRDEALAATICAAWELGTAEHALTARSLVELARAAGVGTQSAGSLDGSQARMHALLGAVEDARALFARDRPALEASGVRPLRAMTDFDEALAVAAAGPRWHPPAVGLLQSAAEAFGALGMGAWRDRAERLLVPGALDAAAQPGGRLHFSYPGGLSRREVDVVRLLATGATVAAAAAALGHERTTIERDVATALAKLGADDPADLPRLARTHGLAGGS